MTSVDIQLVHQFVDSALETWHQSGLMLMPDAAMPVEMRSEAGGGDGDWIPWKPIPSTVTERDLHELESSMGLRYPDLYKEFLRYKHFYDFWSEQEINFFSHGIYEWKDNLLKRYFASWDPTKLIEQGYIYFADYSDWGIICFDTTNQRPEDNDCPVIMIDHDLLYNEPLPLKTLYPSFEAMMRSLRTEQENRV